MVSRAPHHAISPLSTPYPILHSRFGQELRVSPWYCQLTYSVQDINYELSRSFRVAIFYTPLFRPLRKTDLTVSVHFFCPGLWLPEVPLVVVLGLLGLVNPVVGLEGEVL